VPNRKRVLLIEDDRDSLAAMFLALTQAGYSVLTADDGAQAVDLLSKGIHPRLIVLDLVLPKVDGWTVLKHLQEDKELREIPVIVATAASTDYPQVKGADVILEKPLDSERLLTEIARLLGDGAAV
jgi:CheY-like chemotaxis protein